MFEFYIGTSVSASTEMRMRVSNAHDTEIC